MIPPEFDIFKFLIVLAYFTFTAFLIRYIGLKILKELFIGAFRTFFQLAVMGSVLLVVFRVENLALNLCIIAIMIGFAAWTASEHSGKEDTLWLSALVITFTAAVVIGPMVLLDVIQLKASEFIPLSGMVIGNTMNGTSLAYNRLNDEITENIERIEAYLSLGLPPGRACSRLIKRSIKSSMIPAMNSLKVTGLVHIPGLMTGMLISGENPIWAVEMQAIIIYLIFIGVAISSILIVNLYYRHYFRENYALKEKIHSR